ncbi:MAG: glutamyl-tRNA reductase [Gemmatimonadota bacterium]
MSEATPPPGPKVGSDRDPARERSLASPVLEVIGLSHRTAPIEVRERFHVGYSRLEKLLAALTGSEQISECVVLSTCNRTEYYCTVSAPQEAERKVLDMMAQQADLDVDEIRPLLYRHRDYDAVVHLFRVVSGLDSLVLGEPQIQGQVGEAYRQSSGCVPGSVGAVLHRLFQAALSTGGRVRAQTRLAHGSASFPAAAVELARKVFGSLEGRRALVVGAGEMGELTLKVLRNEGLDVALVASRRLERACDASRRVGGKAVPYANVWERLNQVDLVVACTAAPHPILTAEQVDSARPGGSPLVLLDIALPRNIAPEVGDLAEVFLYNIDDLQRVVEEAVEARAEERPAAEAIVADHADQFWHWYVARQAGPLIRLLRERAEEIQAREIDGVLRRLEGVSEEDRERIRMASRASLHKILHVPTVTLRDLASGLSGPELLDRVRRLLLDGGRD